MRAATAVAIPAFTGLAAGYGVLSAISALGAFAVVYGESRPHRTRWKVVLGYGTALTMCAALSSCIGWAIDSWPTDARWTIIVALMTLVAVVTAGWTDAVREPAPGAFLLVLTTELASVLALNHVGSPAIITLWTATGVATALLVSLIAALINPQQPERLALRRAEISVEAVARDSTNCILTRHAVHNVLAAWDCLAAATSRDRIHPLVPTLTALHQRLAALANDAHSTAANGLAVEHIDHTPALKPLVLDRLRWSAPCLRSLDSGVRLAIACIAAGGVAILVNLPRPDWAVITAAMILHQGHDRVLGSWRALHRCIGTLTGITLLAALAVPAHHPAVFVLCLALLFAGAEAFLTIHYAVAMTFSTPLAILLGDLASPEDLRDTALNRATETTLGVIVAVRALWIIAPRAYRAIYHDAELRLHRATTVAMADGAPGLRRLGVC